MNNNVRCFSLVLCAAALFAALTGWLSNSALAQRLTYPIVFRSPGGTLPLGIAVNYGKDVKSFNNKCYYYGDGGYLISFSDVFFDRFKKKGFSLDAVCLGLISQTRYDPETGRHLPTYIIIEDLKEFRKNPDQDCCEATEELPLDLPLCFKNAHPYLDCHFRYGRLSGERLSSGATEIYQQLGEALDRAFQAKLKANPGPYSDKFHGGAPDEELISGYRVASGYNVLIQSDDLDKGQIQILDVPISEFSNNGKVLYSYSSASVWVLSSSLLGSYGYALDADGAAGPSLSRTARKEGIEGLSRPPNIDAVKSVLQLPE